MNYPWIEKANKTFTFVLIAQLLFGGVIAFFTDTWALGLGLGALIIALPLFLIQTRPFDPITRHVVAAAVQLITAVHIQQAQGLTEIHFEIFSLLAVLIFYRDWKVILTSVLVVAVHHVLFFVLQSQSMPYYIFEQDNVYFYILVIHALFAVLEGAVLMYIAVDSHKEAITGIAITDSVHTILENDGKFDLSVKLHKGSSELKEFNRLITSFRSLIEHAKGVSAGAYEGSTQVAQVSSEVSSATDESAQQVNLIATAIEEMTVTNNDVAKRAVDVSSHAEEANTSSNNIKRINHESNDNIQQLKSMIVSTADTIQNLSAKCDRISEVMTSITSISDQTNLLALNAAIESARAGEHGRGFAVVADEVRQLATKTRENAEGISEVVNTLITDANLSVSQMSDCIDKVEAAVTSSNEMSDVMDSVVDGIQNVADNITSVATAAEQQASVSDSISDSTQELHTSAQRQLDAIAGNQREITLLKQRIEELNDELDKFVI